MGDGMQVRWTLPSLLSFEGQRLGQRQVARGWRDGAENELLRLTSKARASSLGARVVACLVYGQGKAGARAQGRGNTV